jgi:hypothetical protein
MDSNNEQSEQSELRTTIAAQFGQLGDSDAERLRNYFAAEIEREQREKAAREHEKEIARRIREQLKLEEREAYRKEMELERLRERDVTQLQPLGVSVSTVKRLYQGKYPLVFLEIPASIIAILESAFDCAGNSALLSKHCSCLISQLGHAWNSEKRRETLEKLGSIPGPRYEVPVLLSIVGGGKSVEMMECAIVAWALAFREMRDEKLALELSSAS